MARIRPLMIAPPVIFLGIVALAAFGMMREDPEALPSARAGKPAPALTLTTLGDKTPFTEADLKNGEVKLVNFFASWCAPCRVEAPNLDELAREGVPIYGVNYKDQPDKAQEFLDQFGDPYVALGVDEKGRTGLDWGLYGVPETYVVDGDGTVLLRFAGPITQRVIEETIRPALEAAGLE